MIRSFLLLYFLVSLFSISVVANEEKSDNSLNDAVTVETVLSVDFLRNIDGGVEREGTILGNFDFTVEVDTQKAGLWDNGTIFAYFLGNFDTNDGMSHYAGDFQASSNIEAVEAIRLYEFWYEHKFSDKLSFLIGMHDYNSEFNALEFASLFINSSFGIQADISQVGPSIFPRAALAGRVKVQPTQNSYLLAALYDGVAGNPHHEKRTAIRFNSDYGIFASVELGLTEGKIHESDYYKLAVGSWYHTAKVENFAAVEDDENRGIYFIGEKTVFANSNNALGAFFQFGFADSKRNQIDRYWGAGLSYKGLFATRSDDLLGLAVANAINSREFKEYSQNIEGNAVNSSETAIELTYEAEIYSWLVFQPNIQYIINPSMNKDIDNALVAGARVTLLY